MNLLAKALIKQLILKALPVGTVREWSSGKYKKKENGEWEKITRRKGTEKEKEQPEEKTKNKKLIDEFENLEEGKTIVISESKWLRKGYHKEDKYSIWEQKGSIHSIFPNKETLIKYANNEIQGIKYKDAKVLNKVVSIVDIEESTYEGQDMEWTEPLTNEYITKEEIYGWHYSRSPVKAFAEKETCFYVDSRLPYINYGYRITIPKGTHVREYGEANEIRINLNKNMEIKELKRGFCDYEEIK